MHDVFASNPDGTRTSSTKTHLISTASSRTQGRRRLAQYGARSDEPLRVPRLGWVRSTAIRSRPRPGRPDSFALFVIERRIKAVDRDPRGQRWLSTRTTLPASSFIQCSSWESVRAAGCRWYS